MVDDECSCGSGKPECACHCPAGQIIRNWPKPKAAPISIDAVCDKLNAGEALARRCTHPRIHLEYYHWLREMRPDEKFFLESRAPFEVWHAIAMLAWSRSREVMKPENVLPQVSTGPANVDEKPTTDEWTDLTGSLKDETDSHVSMFSHLPPDSPEVDERYQLRRMFFISLRQFFRETSIEELARLKNSA